MWEDEEDGGGKVERNQVLWKSWMNTKSTFCMFPFFIYKTLDGMHFIHFFVKIRDRVE